MMTDEEKKKSGGVTNAALLKAAAQAIIESVERRQPVKPEELALAKEALEYVAKRSRIPVYITSMDLFKHTLDVIDGICRKPNRPGIFS